MSNERDDFYEAASRAGIDDETAHRLEDQDDPVAIIMVYAVAAPESGVALATRMEMATAIEDFQARLIGDTLRDFGQALLEHGLQMPGLRINGVDKH